MKETQQFLNYYLRFEIKPLTIDGKIPHFLRDGKTVSNSRKAITLAIEKLQKLTLKKGLIWDDEFMFIGLRTDDDIDNTFEDWFILIEKNYTFTAVPASTVSGTQGIWKYWDRWVSGRKGVGTIAENQQIDYRVITTENKAHWNWSWTGAGGFLFQDKPIKLYRGAKQVNGVWEIDKSNPVPNSTGGGFNVHSWLNWLILLVNNLSEGCQVTLFIYWKIIFPIIIRNAKKIKNNGETMERVTYTLLQDN